MSTLTDFLLARIAEDERTADLHERLLAPQLGRLPQELLDTLVPPARLRAECESKRRVIAKVAEIEFNSGEPWTYEMGDEILASLGATYADHPDYDETWRP